MPWNFISIFEQLPTCGFAPGLLLLFWKGWLRLLCHRPSRCSHSASQSQRPDSQSQFIRTSQRPRHGPTGTTSPHPVWASSIHWAHKKRLAQRFPHCVSALHCPISPLTPTSTILVRLMVSSKLELASEVLAEDRRTWWREVSGDPKNDRDDHTRPP